MTMLQTAVLMNRSAGICTYVTTRLCVSDTVSIYVLSPFFSQAQRVCGEGGHAGRPEAAVRAGLHTHGQSVEARLRGTVVVHGIRKKVSDASPPTICLHLSPSRVENLWQPVQTLPFSPAGVWRALPAGAKH